MPPVAVGEGLLPLLLQPHQAFGDLADFARITAGEALLIVGVPLLPVLGKLLIKAGEVVDDLVGFFFG